MQALKKIAQSSGQRNRSATGGTVPEIRSEFVLDADEARAFYEALQSPPEVCAAVKEAIAKKRSQR